jgi:hypothetical protein
MRSSQALMLSVYPTTEVRVLRQAHPSPQLSASSSPETSLFARKRTPFTLRERELTQYDVPAVSDVRAATGGSSSCGKEVTRAELDVAWTRKGGATISEGWRARQDLNLRLNTRAAVYRDTAMSYRLRYPRR